MILHPSPNHGPRPEGTPIDMLVLHYTGMADGPSALSRLCDPAAEVSAHYLIEEDGRIFALVPEERRAWHAGLSSWRGHSDINSRSIGIELVNPGHDHGLRPFPDTQMTALLDLSRGILARHPIPARNVVGHSDVAPGRKIDPGELFDWGWLAAHDVGLWPAEPSPPAPVEAMLAHYGYAPEPQALAAFQRHFRPRRIDGVTDAETLGLMAGLLAQVAG